MYFSKGSVIETALTTPTSGGTLTLSSNSETYQIFTGTQSHTLKLPDATGLPSRRFEVLNASTGTITVQDNGNNTIGTVSAGLSIIFRLADNSSSNGVWDVTVASTGGSAALSTQESAQFNALAAKGFSGSSIVLKYNPEEIGGNFWITKAPLPISKATDAFTLNGFGYAVGGYAGAESNTNYSYNNDLNGWSTKSNIPIAKYDAATFVIGGFGYHVGGQTNSQTSGITNNNAYKYTDATDSWALLTNLNTPTRSSGSGAYGLGYVIGGFNGSVGTSNKVQSYNPTTNAWILYTSVLPQTVYLPASFANKDKLHVAGGTNGPSTIGTNYAWDAVSNAALTKTPMSAVRQTTGSSDDAGFGYALGGYSGSYITSGERYNFDNNIWQSVAARANAVQTSPCGGLTLNSVVYILGAYGPSTSNVVESFVPVSFYTISQMRKSLAAPSSVSANVILNALAANVPVQIRTDGNTWINATSGGNLLKLGESLNNKLAPTTNIFTFSGAGGGPAIEFYSPDSDSWSTKLSVTPTNGYMNFAYQGKTYLPGGDQSATYHQVYDSLANTLTNKAALPQKQYLGGSFFLNGLGYAVAGVGPSVTIADVNAYNPVTDAWATKTSYPATTYDSGSAPLGGFGFCWSGSTASNGSLSGLTTNSYKYTDTTNAWTSITALPTAGIGQDGVVLDSIAFIFGLYGAGNTNIATTYKYDQATNGYTTTANIITNSSYPGSGRYDGLAYSLGGYRAGTGVVNNAAKYNPYSNAWASITGLSSARYEGASSAAYTGAVYKYDLRVGIPAYFTGVGAFNWATKSPLSYTGAGHNAPFTVGGKVYGSAGFTTVSGNSRDNKAQTYDTVLDFAYREIDYPISVSGNSSGSSSSTALYGLGYGFGGDNGSAFANAYTFNVETHTWTSITNLPAGDTYAATYPINGLMYIVGGASQNNTMKQYNPVTAAYTSKTSSTSPHAYGGGGAFNGLGYAYGCGTPSITAVNEQFNDASNSWLTKTALPAPRELPSCMIFADTMFAAGGYNSGVVATNYGYKDSMNLWITYSSITTGTYEPSNGVVNGTGYVVGGYNGSVYTTAIFSLVNSVKQAVLSASLNIS